MTPTEFKTLWESDDDGGGITFKIIAQCAIDWSIDQYPRTKPMSFILYEVLKAANTVDAEEYNPEIEAKND